MSMINRSLYNAIGKLLTPLRVLVPTLKGSPTTWLGSPIWMTAATVETLDRPLELKGRGAYRSDQDSKEADRWLKNRKVHLL